MVYPPALNGSAFPARSSHCCSGASGAALDINHYRPAIHAYLRRRGLRGEDVEDLTQETLLRAYVHLSDFNGANIGGWLYRIAANLAIDHHRRHLRARTLPLEWAARYPAAGDPVAAVLGPGGFADVMAQVEALTPGQQELIHLRFREQRSIREIAQGLGCSHGAARLRLFRAVEALRKRCSPAP